MAIAYREVRADEIAAVIPILRQAEQSESALRWSLAHLSDTVYRMDQDGQLVGAATSTDNGAAHQAGQAGPHTVAIQAIDIRGNDTTTSIGMEVRQRAIVSFRNTLYAIFGNRPNPKIERCSYARTRRVQAFTPRTSNLSPRTLTAAS